MTRLILSKSFLPEGTNTLAKQQTLFTLHAPTMQGQICTQWDAESVKVKLKNQSLKLCRFHFIQTLKTTYFLYMK